jgi:hypothetical protein
VTRSEVRRRGGREGLVNDYRTNTNRRGEGRDGRIIS